MADIVMTEFMDEVAVRARALGMDVIAHDPFVASTNPAWSLARPMGLEAMLHEAAVISLPVPLTDTTRDRIDEMPLGTIRKDAMMLNEQALAAALRSGRIGGAALDVFQNEPS